MTALAFTPYTLWPEDGYDWGRYWIAWPIFAAVMLGALQALLAGDSGLRPTRHEIGWQWAGYAALVAVWLGWLTWESLR